MPPSDAAIARYKRQIAIYRQRTADALTLAWDQLDTLDEEAVIRYVVTTAPQVAAAKSAAVTLSAGFFALAMRVRPVGVRATDVPVQPRLNDPFLAAWHALNVGRPFEEAVQVGRSQAEATAFDFVQSAARQTGDVVADRSGRQVRWQRVPGAGACDWCRGEASKTFPTAAAADFGHSRCDCDAIPT